MSKSPWIALYPSDYLADTAHLGLTEHGVYWRLLLHYYQHERPLPADPERICRLVLAMTPEERRIVEHILTEFFVASAMPDGTRVWRHRRADREIEHAQQRRAKAHDRARAGADARWGVNASSNAASNASSIQQAMLEQCQPQPQPHPEPQPHASDEAIAADSKIRPSPAAKAERALAKRPAKSDGSQSWDAYAGAYLARYGTEPLRNARVNGQLAQFAKRVPADEAPHVARWYVASNTTLYVRSKHCVDLLLRDCEGLRTEWATSRRVTDTDARQADQHQSAQDAARWVADHMDDLRKARAEGKL